MIPRELISAMGRKRLVAEVRTETAIQALGVVDALVEAGVQTIEVSLAIPGAQEILGHLAQRQDALIGAGSVVDAQQAREAIAFGARFIASPILNMELLHTCREANVACVPGALTPSEIMAAQRAGAEMVKIFPAEAFGLGGPGYVRALFRQITHLSLQVSGGVTAENFVEYLELPVRTFALGDLLVPPMLVDRGAWPAITSRARAFVDFIASPHEYAARFLPMIGVAPRPKPIPGTQRPISEQEAAGSFKPLDSKPASGKSDTEGWLR